MQLRNKIDVSLTTKFFLLFFFILFLVTSGFWAGTPPFSPSHYSQSSVTWFVSERPPWRFGVCVARQTIAKCPIFLHFRHSLPAAGHVWKRWLELPQFLHGHWLEPLDPPEPPRPCGPPPRRDESPFPKLRLVFCIETGATSSGVPRTGRARVASLRVTAATVSSKDHEFTIAMLRISGSRKFVMKCIRK